MSTNRQSGRTSDRATRRSNDRAAKTQITTRRLDGHLTGHRIIESVQLYQEICTPQTINSVRRTIHWRAFSQTFKIEFGASARLYWTDFHRLNRSGYFVLNKTITNLFRSYFKIIYTDANEKTRTIQ